MGCKKSFKFYTDGTKTIKIYKNTDKIPDGFYPGRTIKSNPWNKGLTKETSEKVRLNTEHCHETRRKNGTYSAWNKGLTKETDERVAINYEHTKESIKKKYGVDNIIYYITKQPDYKVWNKGLTKDTDDTVKLMSEHHKGVTAWNKGLTRDTDERVNKYAKKWDLGIPQNKRYKTQRLNGTLGKNKGTKPELELYEKLKNQYGEEDVIFQYRSEEYPFNCDFYIKSKDLYIEYNGFFTHGKHPYNKNSEDDTKLANKLKKSDNKFYKCFLYTWTDLDVRKWETAVKNNLNFMAIYPKINDEDIVYTHWKQCEE